MRPATPVVCAFIDEHAEEFGVVPICRALTVHGVQIAPRTYWAHRSAGPSKRELWDTTITEILSGVYEPDEKGKRPPESLYGSLKVWAYLQRQGIPVARCTVERIMAANGWRGATRARRVRTTVADPTHNRAPDLVRRRFRVGRPDALHCGRLDLRLRSPGSSRLSGQIGRPTPNGPAGVGCYFDERRLRRVEMDVEQFLIGELPGQRVVCA